MARGKKKSKAQQHIEEDEDHSSNASGEDTDKVQQEPEAVDQQSHKSGSPAASDNDSDDEGDDKAKKKAYRGNKLKRIEEVKSRKDKKRGGKGGKGANEAAKTQEEEQAAAKSNDDDDEELEVTRQVAVEVLYCPICTFPAEMCEFSGMMEKCRPWLQEHAAELADAEERGRKRRILTEKERLEAMIEGRGIKQALERVVVMDVEKRTGRRMITSVFGMDLFGFNLKDLSKDWRKAFACGAGVRAPEEGKHQECIDIQGSVADQLAEMLVKKYKVPKESIYIMESKKRKKYFD